MKHSARDVKGGFYKFPTPEAMSEHFCLRPLSARELQVSTAGGCSASPEQLVFPQLRALLMGFSFALRWAQAACLSKVSRLNVPGSVGQLFDFHPAPSETVWQIVYVC